MSLKNVTITDMTRNETTAAFREGDTLGDLLDFLGYTGLTNMSIEVNGTPEDDSYVLEAGDRITLTPKKHKSGTAE